MRRLLPSSIAALKNCRGNHHQARQGCLFLAASGNYNINNFNNLFFNFTSQQQQQAQQQHRYFNSSSSNLYSQQELLEDTKPATANTARPTAPATVKAKSSRGHYRLTMHDLGELTRRFEQISSTKARIAELQSVFIRLYRSFEVGKKIQQSNDADKQAIAVQRFIEVVNALYFILTGNSPVKEQPRTMPRAGTDLLVQLLCKVSNKDASEIKTLIKLSGDPATVANDVRTFSCFFFKKNYFYHFCNRVVFFLLLFRKIV